MTNDSQRGGTSGLGSALLTDRLKEEALGLAGALGERAVTALSSAAERLTEYAEDGGGPGLAAAITGAKQLAEGKSPGRAALGAGMKALKSTVGGLFKGGKSGGKGRGNRKITNIAESIDVGAPVRLTYDQWTQFRDFPTFMKKVETVQQESDEKLNFKAQIFLSHRTWESTIMQQHPDERIIWRSKGSKGSVDGTVTFHELAPNLTRIMLEMEYFPQGLFERTGNIWRAQGRRTRLELKHFRRHLMSHALLEPDKVEGWRGVIEDGQVVKDHQTAVEEERHAEGEGAAEDDRGEPEYEEEDEYEDEDQDEPEDEDEHRDEAAYQDEPEDEDEYQDEAAYQDEPEDEEEPEYQDEARYEEEPQYEEEQRHPVRRRQVAGHRGG
jgi:uncharacterized membrane protein